MGGLGANVYVASGDEYVHRLQAALGDLVATGYLMEGHRDDVALSGSRMSRIALVAVVFSSPRRPCGDQQRLVFPCAFHIFRLEDQDEIR